MNSNQLTTPQKRSPMEETTGTTKNKRPLSGEGIPATPSPLSKQSLNFDFWGERSAKVPKVIIDDLEEVQISELLPKVLNRGKLIVICTTKFDRTDQAKMMKFLLENDVHSITITGFGANAIKLKNAMEVGNWYSVSGFDVKLGNPLYKCGNYGDLELFFTDKTQIQKVVRENEFYRQFQPSTIDEVEQMADDTIIDLFGIIVMEWELRQTGSGQKIDLSLTDKSKRTIRITVWGDDAEKLQGMQNQLVGFKRCVVATFQGVKCINFKWFSAYEINPPGEAGETLTTWFEEEINRK